MFLAFCLTLLLIASGTGLSYLFDRDSPPITRLASGICIGFSLFAPLSFLFASFVGLNALSIGARALIMALAAVWSWRRTDRVLIREQWQAWMASLRNRRSLVPLVVMTLLFLVVVLAFSRVMYRKQMGFIPATPQT
jgi:hypothetical protein